MIVEDIAKLCNLKESTIETHLADLVYHGRITDITPFMPKEIQDSIRGTLEQNNTDKLKTIKEQLPEHITYGQIKIVLAVYQRSQPQS